MIKRPVTVGPANWVVDSGKVGVCECNTIQYATEIAAALNRDDELVRLLRKLEVIIHPQHINRDDEALAREIAHMLAATLPLDGESKHEHKVRTILEILRGSK